MSKRIFVYSTLASDVAYTDYAKGGADLPVALPPVLIKGGAGVMDRKRDETYPGILTVITEEQLEYCRRCPTFRLHEQNGFIAVREDKQVDIEKAVADMQGRDNSAPIVPEDLTEEEQPASIGGKPSKPLRR